FAQSREAAQESSPRRKPWVSSRRRLSPGGAKESFRIDNSWGGLAPLFRPDGARDVAALHPRLTPWAAFFRRYAAGPQFTPRTSPPPVRGRRRPLRKTGAAGSRTFRPEYWSGMTGSSYSGR